MAKDDPPSFQFYPRDLLTSRKVLAMSPEGRGAYLFLLCHAWLSDRPGTLPNDQRLLCSLSGVPATVWSRVAGEVLAAFDIEGGRLVQRRMVEERCAQLRRLQLSIQGGKLRARGKRDSQGRLVSSLTSRWSPPPASASASSLESKEGGSTLSVSAACLARCRKTFPEVDIEVVEAKLLAEHGAHPFKSLDRALVNWCRAARQRGMDLKPRPEPSANGRDGYSVLPITETRR